MGRTHVTRRDGAEATIEAEDDLSVMEGIRNDDIDGLLALCGGCLACATCHVQVDAAWIARAGKATQDEIDLLAASDHLSAGSRLSCQIRMSPELDGLCLTIAPEE